MFLLFSLITAKPPSFHGLFLTEGEAEELPLENTATEYVATNFESNSSPKMVFFFCTVQIFNSTANESLTFGPTETTGYGGVMYLENSTVSILKCNFSFCQSPYGGVCATIDSILYISESQFNSNIAFRVGGSIFFQGGITIEAHYSEFQNNKASLAGAAAIYNAQNAYFSNVNMTSNIAQIAGGALDLSGVSTLLFFSNFFYNTVNCSNQPISNLSSSEKPNSIYNIRGGGAIFFLGSKNTDVLYAQNCCFGGNNVTKGFANQFHDNGADILFAGQTAFQSFDTLASITSSNNNFSSYIFGDDINSCSIVNSTFDSTTISLMATNRPSNNSVAYVPSPSIYTYVATPITRLPYATTSSFIKTQNLTTLLMPTRIIKRSPFPTHARTYDYTPIRTHARTYDYTPIRTHARTYDYTPSSTYARTPYNTPSTSRETTPRKSMTPTNSLNPTKTPKPNHIFTQVETSTYTSVVISVESVIVGSKITESTTSTISGGQTIFISQSFIIYEYSFVTIWGQTVTNSFIIMEIEETEVNKGLSNTSIIMISTICGLLALICAALAVFFFRQSKRDEYEISSSDSQDRIINQSFMMSDSFHTNTTTLEQGLVDSNNANILLGAKESEFLKGF